MTGRRQRSLWRWARSRRAGSRSGRSRWGHAARVALAVASLIAVLYIAVAVSFDVVDTRHLVAEVDGRVQARLQQIVGGGSLNTLGPSHLLPADKDVDDAPVVVWVATTHGPPVGLTLGSPPLPAGAWSRSPQAATTAFLGQGWFRVLALPMGHSWLVGAQSLAATQHVEAVVDRAELVAGPILVLAMFFGALGIGIMASRPIEQARQRQLDFTADASHELRTPLTVIEAEVGLALSAPRDSESYQGTIQRIGTESKRLRHIVEDLLFLARFDSKPPAPHNEPVDLPTLVNSSTQRFLAVARARHIALFVASEAADHVLIEAPPGWVDQLCGVLVDNACRYAGEGGWVRVIVAAHGNSVSLAVEDSGPGIRPDERPLLFDRFQRGNDGREGAGLGLAIADAVVRSTGGKWRVGDAPGGGARMEVVWHRFRPREAALQKEDVEDVAGVPANHRRVRAVGRSYFEEAT
ncbi:MAG TPA: HAMP domain-containing sensor histidine kinase [Acidimicrobiales bacterium]|nr:HAMP domain-containing sensor histidine kinase [Acidimicrobiales bacterium]